MIVGVIGSGSIGPDLAYGFVSALAKTTGDKPGGGKVYLMDISPEALESGIKRIQGYVKKGVDRGKLHPKVAAKVSEAVVPTSKLQDLADCDYVIESATENLAIKQKILADLEQVVRPDCLIGFATSGLPRAQITAEAAHPERCFVNHPFFPAWRSPPMEVVLSEDEELSARMIATLKTLGKVPVVTADVACFAADDIFCTYCAEAARIFVEGVATPAQVDKIVNEAIGGGGPFNVMDLTGGNLLNVHCLELMRDAPTGSPWFEPPAIFSEQANTPWHDRKNPGDPEHTEEQRRQVTDRILAVVLGRTFFVADNEICAPGALNWLTRNALGFRVGLLDLAAELGMERVHEICSAYAAEHPGFEVPSSVLAKQMPDFYRNLIVERDEELAVVTICRPEVMNALNEQTLEELKRAIAELAADDAVAGIVLTSFGGSLAGADIGELAAIKTSAEAEQKCFHGQEILAGIAALDKPVVVAVDGPVLGGGAELSMACHARVVGPGLMLGQPEVNLGIIPGYGGTQRLPRLIGLEKSVAMLRTGAPIGAAEACELGWAAGEPTTDVVAAAKELLRRHLSGEVTLSAVDPQPLDMPASLPTVDIGQRSLAIDAILVDVIRNGLRLPLAEGLKAEAAGFASSKETVDYGIGMTNFLQNGPRVPAAFMHE